MKLALIPARGGSKRIPRKNLKPFAGRPVIAYSIEAALACGLFDHVVVSTDDEEIEAAARSCGAEVPFRRPPELADDHAGLMPVIRHAIEWYASRGEAPSHLCCILATAPFVRAEHLRQAHDRLLASGHDYAFPVTTFPCPIQRALNIGADGTVTPRFPDMTGARSQEMGEAWHDAGQFYWGRAQAFLDDVAVLSSASLAIKVPRHAAQDIDTAEDWQTAELMYEALHRREERERAA
jgi:pseudaminic acid cytidylyltransferase